MSDELCVEQVSDGWFSHQCGRKAKEEGLCGIHLRSKRQREEKARRFEEERVLSNKNHEQAWQVVTYLGQHNIDARPEYDTKTLMFTGGVTIRPSSMERFREFLEGVRDAS